MIELDEFNSYLKYGKGIRMRRAYLHGKMDLPGWYIYILMAMILTYSLEIKEQKCLYTTQQSLYFGNTIRMGIDSIGYMKKMSNLVT